MVRDTWPGNKNLYLTSFSSYHLQILHPVCVSLTTGLYMSQDVTVLLLFFFILANECRVGPAPGTGCCSDPCTNAASATLGSAVCQAWLCKPNTFMDLGFNSIILDFNNVVLRFVNLSFINYFSQTQISFTLSYFEFHGQIQTFIHKPQTLFPSE